MKTGFLLFLTAAICGSFLTACGGSAPGTVNIQGTVDAAIVATQQAQTAQQATIEAAVAGTRAAESGTPKTVAATATPGVEALVSAEPEPTPVATPDSALSIASVTRIATVHTLKGHTDTVFSVAFSPDGKLLATGSDDMTVRLWNPVTGQARRTLNEGTEPQPSPEFLDLAFSPVGQILVSASNGDPNVMLWRPDTYDLLTFFRIEDRSRMVSSVAFSPDGRTLALGQANASVVLLDPATNESFVTLNGSANFDFEGNYVAFSPNGRYLASVGNDSDLQLWSVSNGLLLRTIHTGNDFLRLKFRYST